MPNLKERLEARLAQGMVSIANDIAKRARSNASWSNHIPNAISVGEVKKESGRFTIEIKVDARPDGPAPEAAAYEYGSGVHNPKKAQKYLIKPKNVSTLAFFWDKVDAGSPTGKKFLGISPLTGKALFSYVEHPGVVARPYLKPAVNSLRTKIPLFFGSLISRAYRESEVKVTVIK